MSVITSRPDLLIDVGNLNVIAFRLMVGIVGNLFISIYAKPTRLRPPNTTASTMHPLLIRVAS